MYTKKLITICATVMLLMMVFGGAASATNGFSGTRSISDSSVKAGDSFTVTVVMDFYEVVEGPSINETLPSGWILTQIDDQEAEYKASSNEWFWISDMDAGDKITIVYEVTVPSNSAGGTYYIAGEVSGFDSAIGKSVQIDTIGDSSISIVAAPSTSSSSGSSGGGGGGGGGSSGEKYENIAKKEVESIFINKGSEIKYEFESEGNAINFIQFNALKNSGKISTTIEVLKDRSTFADSDSPGLVYQNINVWVGKVGFATADNIETPSIGFRVAKDWMGENSVSSDNVRLYRYSDDSWNELETNVLSEDDNYVYFESQTPGFSPFTISASTADSSVVDDVSGTEEQLKSVLDEQVSAVTGAEESTPEEETHSTPALGLTGSLFVLVLVGLFVERRNNK